MKLSLASLLKYKHLFMLAFILFFTPIIRFAWDLNTQTIVHIIVVASIFVFINCNKIYYRFYPYGLFVLFYFSALFSFYSVSDKSFSFQQLILLFDCFVLAYFVSFLPNEQKKVLILIPVVVGFFMATVAIAWFIINPIKYILPDVLIINPANLAAYLAISLPLSFIFIENNNRFSLIVPVILFVSIITTRSRSAIMVSSIVLIIQLLRHFKLRPFFIGIFILTVAGIIGYVSILKYASLDDRFNWYAISIKMFLHNPLTGIGWGNFSNLFLFFRTSQSLNTIYAHNIIFQMLAETGLVGLTLIVIVITACLKRGIALSKDSIFFRSILLAIISFLALNMLDYSFYIPALMILFWVLSGSLFVSQKEKRNRNILPRGFLIVPIIISSLLISLPAVSNIYYEQSLNLMQKNEFLEAETKLLKSIKYYPFASIPYTTLSHIHYRRYLKENSAEQLKKAIEIQLKVASRIKYNAGYWSDLAWLYWTSGQRDTAVKYIKKAIIYDAYNPKYAEVLSFFCKQ